MSNQLDVILSKLLKVPSVFRIGKQHNIHSFIIVLGPTFLRKYTGRHFTAILRNNQSITFYRGSLWCNEYIKYEKWAKYNIMMLIFTKYAIKLKKMSKYAYSNSQNMTLIRSFVLNMLQNLRKVQICTYMPNENRSIFFRMLGIEFKSVWKPKQSHSKKYDMS